MACIPRAVTAQLVPSTFFRLAEALLAVSARPESPHSRRAYRDAGARLCPYLAAPVAMKRGKLRQGPVPPWLSAESDEWCGDEGIDMGPLFPAHHGGSKAVGSSTVWNAVRRAALRSGVELARCTPHALRRSFVT